MALRRVTTRPIHEVQRIAHSAAHIRKDGDSNRPVAKPVIGGKTLRRIFVK